MKQSLFILLLSLSLISSNLFAQKSKKTKKTKTVTTTTTTTTKSTKNSETKEVEAKSNLLPEEQKKQDFSIGKKLSSLVKADSLKANTSSGITVRRYVSNEDGKLGADIFEASPDSKFNQSSIESILAGYIENHFEYNTEDSELLSNLIIQYNIKNRKNQDYLIKNYSTNIVLGTKKEKIGFPENSSPEKIAGLTQILLPTEKNILKKSALDVASLELNDQLKSNLEKKENEELSKKVAKFLKRKSASEMEEVSSRLLTATPAEVKGLNEKLAQLKLREEMSKQNITSERDFTGSTKEKKTTTTTTTTTSTSTMASVNAPEIPKNKFTTFIYGANHPGINAKEFISIPGMGIVSLGYDASKFFQKDLQVFITSNGDHLLKKTSEGLKLSPDSPLVYSGGKVYVLEMLKNEAFVAQFNSELEFESRSDASVNSNSAIQVVGEEVIVTSLDKTQSKPSVKVFKVKDLSLVK